MPLNHHEGWYSFLSFSKVKWRFVNRKTENQVQQHRTALAKDPLEAEYFVGLYVCVYMSIY